jgi:RNA polymerase sigma-70 factor (ECF subfamily)
MRSEGPATEADLVRRAAGGDQEAFAALVRRYQSPLVSFAYRYLGSREEAEDVAQDAFVRAYFALKDLRNSRAFAAYLFRIALNLSRKRWARRAVCAPGPPAPQPSAEAEALARAEWDRVARAITELPEEYRAPVSLRVDDGLSFAEIGELLGVSEGACRMRYHRARQMLREQLGYEAEATEEAP